MAQLFPDDPPQIGLQSFSSPPDMVLEGIVDHGLVAAAASSIDLPSKPIEDLIIEPDRNAGLARQDGNGGPSLAIAGIITFFGSHWYLINYICTFVHLVKQPKTNMAVFPVP